jgi:hypothetical protein
VIIYLATIPFTSLNLLKSIEFFLSGNIPRPNFHFLRHQLDQTMLIRPVHFRLARLAPHWQFAAGVCYECPSADIVPPLTAIAVDLNAPDVFAAAARTCRALVQPVPNTDRVVLVSAVQFCQRIFLQANRARLIASLQNLLDCCQLRPHYLPAYLIVSNLLLCPFSLPLPEIYPIVPAPSRRIALDRMLGSLPDPASMIADTSAADDDDEDEETDHYDEGHF